MVNFCAAAASKGPMVGFPAPMRTMSQKLAPRATLALTAVVVSMATASIPNMALAQAGLPLQEVSRGDVRVDGMLRDWRAVRMIDVGRGDDGAMSFALGYDATGLYLAARVRDTRLIRNRRPGRAEDAVIITLATPTGADGAFVGHDVYLWPGVSGRLAGAVGVAPAGGRPRTVRGARIVEAPLPRGGGFTLEAHVPWRLIPNHAAWQQGRGAVRYRDVDSEARPEVVSEPSSAPVVAEHLERLPPLVPSGGEAAVLAAFLRERGIPGTRPRHDLRGDVCGDARPERVVLVGRFAVVLGEGYRDGRGFDFLQLPIESAADVRRAGLRDLTADGKKELTVRLRQSGARGNRDVWQVISFDCEHVNPVFGIELRKETGDGSVEARMRIRPGRRRAAATIEVSAGRSRGLTATNFQEAPATDAEPILLPWADVIGRSYRWNGRSFARVAERANPRPQPEEAPATTAEAAVAPAAPAPPTSRELIAAVRRERHVPRRTRPRFQRQVNVAEDGQAETLLTLGKALVVVGPGFRGGSGYFHYELPLANPQDLIRLETADLTGDGRAEILLTVRQVVGDVNRELLLVHRFTRAGFPRILAVEVAREQGANSLRNQVRITGRGRQRALQIRAGRARGWSAENYPFRDEAQNGIQPPLLPWAGRDVRYRFAGERLVPR